MEQDLLDLLLFVPPLEVFGVRAFCYEIVGLPLLHPLALAKFGLFMFCLFVFFWESVDKMFGPVNLICFFECYLFSSLIC